MSGRRPPGAPKPPPRPPDARRHIGYQPDTEPMPPLAHCLLLPIGVSRPEPGPPDPAEQTRRLVEQCEQRMAAIRDQLVGLDEQYPGQGFTIHAANLWQELNEEYQWQQQQRAQLSKIVDAQRSAELAKHQKRIDAMTEALTAGLFTVSEARARTERRSRAADLESYYDNRYYGARDATKPMVLNSGMTIQPLPSFSDRTAFGSKGGTNGHLVTTEEPVRRIQCCDLCKCEHWGSSCQNSQCNGWSDERWAWHDTRAWWDSYQPDPEGLEPLPVRELEDRIWACLTDPPKKARGPMTVLR